MASATDYRRFGTASLVVASSGVLLWFGTGLNPWWPLLWFAPLPVLLFASRGTWREAALTAAISWLIRDLNMWHYLHGVLHAPASMLAPILGIPVLAFTLAVLLFRALLRRGAWWSALVAFPAAWVSFEYLLNLVSPHGTAASLSYAQLNFLPFLQLASLTGPWGMSFVVLLFSAALAIGAHFQREALRVVGAGLGVVVLALAFGAVRLMQPTSGQHVKIGLIASD